MRISDWSSDVCSSDLPLAARQHEAGDADGIGRCHGLADHREGLLRHLVVGHEVIGGVVPHPLDAVGGHELLDVDGARALQADRLQLVVLQHDVAVRSEEHTSELQSLMRISYAVFCLKKKNITHKTSYIN